MWPGCRWSSLMAIERVRYREFMKIVTRSSPPLECIGMSHTRGLTCQRSLKCYFVFIDYCVSFIHVFICMSCGGMTKCSQFSREIYHVLNWENYSKVCIHPWHDHQKLIWPICAFLMQETKLSINALFHKSGITKWWIEFNTYNFKEPLTSSAEGDGCKTD